ncbi:50S ribosomal protein L19e [Metallosphaera hakonensis]|uniref:Large ribosomal subunit protein eL19 n=1 Tax=Metallosphaera hakonensis JCM 8857 = DSM 7519 TaxID=1293036 RepID=A0A2U9ITN4_9CREN|nr:50S ribosomal protein L19e [Metallosphaera hakonensis]AWR99396.1 50S ribosomal protein L19e [Metallosphaera hakonensis JCM 8857 = DSM 7519]
MAELELQKRLAADIKGTGKGRIRIPPENADEVAGALTRDDIRKLIKDGKIIVLSAKGNSRGRIKERRRNRKRKGEGRKTGSKNGRKGAREARKDRWIATIRKIRNYLRWLRDHDIIDEHTYRAMYIKAKGGTFKSLGDVKTMLKQMGKLRE